MLHKVKNSDADLKKGERVLSVRKQPSVQRILLRRHPPKKINKSVVVVCQRRRG